MSARMKQESKLDLSGERLGDYELLMRLASGGMGAVYVARAARQGGFERLFAVKCCHPFLLDDPTFLPMFMEEARLSALVRHPNVVATVDVGEAHQVPYLVMEYVEGAPLASLLRHAVREKTPLPVGLVVRVIIDALHGLHATHEACDLSGESLGLIHRDVSPQNLIVGLDGTTRLADFGVAKAASRSSLTREGTIKGKFAYVAPEALRLEPVDRRADLFAIGVVLWEALESQRLFVGSSDPETLQRVLHLPVPQLQAREGVTPGLEAILARALDRDPHKRFETAAAMAHALEHLHVAVPASEAGRAIESSLGEELRATRLNIVSSIRKQADTASGSIPLGSPQVAPPRRPRSSPDAAKIALGFALIVAALSVAGATYVLTRAPEATPIVATPLTPDLTALPVLPPTAAIPVEADEPVVTAVVEVEEREPEPTEEPALTRESPRHTRRPRVEQPERHPTNFRPTEL